MLKLFKWIYKLGYEKGFSDGEKAGANMQLTNSFVEEIIADDVKDIK
jgi:hypothetical protein